MDTFHDFFEDWTKIKIPSEICPIFSAKLSNKMEKLNLRGLWTIQDHHIKEIITRCKNLTELELRYTQITDKSINTLIEYASENLVRLGVDTYSNVEFFKILELKSMSKLKVLNFYGEDLSLDERQSMKKYLAHVSINREPIQIACSNQRFQPENGLWDKPVKQIEVFQKRRF